MGKPTRKCARRVHLHLKDLHLPSCVVDAFLSKKWLLQGKERNDLRIDILIEHHKNVVEKALASIVQKLCSNEIISDSTTGRHDSYVDDENFDCMDTKRARLDSPPEYSDDTIRKKAWELTNKLVFVCDDYCKDMSKDYSARIVKQALNSVGERCIVEEEAVPKKLSKDLEITNGIVDNIKNLMSYFDLAHPVGAQREDFRKMKSNLVAFCAPYSEDSITNPNNVAKAIGCSSKLVNKWFQLRKGLTHHVSKAPAKLVNESAAYLQSQVDGKEEEGSDADDESDSDFCLSSDEESQYSGSDTEPEEGNSNSRECVPAIWYSTFVSYLTGLVVALGRKTRVDKINAIPYVTEFCHTYRIDTWFNKRVHVPSYYTGGGSEWHNVKIKVDTTAEMFTKFLQSPFYSQWQMVYASQVGKKFKMVVVKGVRTSVEIMPSFGIEVFRRSLCPCLRKIKGLDCANHLQVS